MINIKVDFGDEVDRLNRFKMAAELNTIFLTLHDKDKVMQEVYESYLIIIFKLSTKPV